MHSFSTKFRPKGFTLIELLISVGIIAILTTIVVARYKSFDSTTLLKGEAYEIALSLREAQVQSVSVVRGSAGFDFPRGISFTPGQTLGKSYMIFQYATTSTLVTPHYDIPEPDPDLATVLATLTLDGSMYISQVCVTTDTGTYCDTNGSTSRLDISFRRPEFKALFYATIAGSNYSTGVSSAQIKVSSLNNVANVFVVDVSMLGQIGVKKQ